MDKNFMNREHRGELLVALPTELIVYIVSFLTNLYDIVKLRYARRYVSGRI